MNEQNVGTIFSIIFTPEIVVVEAIVVVGGYCLGHTVPRRLRLRVRVLDRPINSQRLFLDSGLFHDMRSFGVRPPSERLISPERKLRRLKSDTPRRVVEIAARTLGGGLALFLMVYIIKCSLDTREILSGNGPPTISGKVTDQRHTALAWVFYQNITLLRPDGSTEDYSLFFHPRVPVGQNCRFRILPRCKTILSIEVSP